VGSSDIPMKQGIVVDGKLITDSACATFTSHDPATGQPLAELMRCGAAEVDLAVRSSAAAFARDNWRMLPTVERGRIVMKIGELLLANLEELAHLEARDVGKPISQARNDVRGAARYFEYYGSMADKILGATIPVRPGAFDFTVREPHGISVQIVPWNYPLLMAGRGIAPALAAGNCVIVKPAEDASLSLLRLGMLVNDAGLPPGVLNVITGLGPEAGALLVRHPLVNHVTFTGSVATGSKIMQMAGEGVKPVALELGGKSPNIVFGDADLDIAAPIVARAILYNAGQTCNSCPRLLVHRSVAKLVVERLREQFGAMRLGAPLSDPDMGPLVSQRQLEKVESYVEIADGEGVRVERFGARPSDGALAGGYFTLPTLLTGVESPHRVFQEEIFGPVLTVTEFDTVDEAIQLANATEYGLNAGVFTRDINTAFKLARRIQAGQVYINGYGTGGAVEVPFGGFKKSGFSREKGVEGLLHYTQIKSITVHIA